MSNVSTKKLKNEEEILANFSCGQDLEYLNIKVKNCYYSVLCRQEDVYVCRIDDEIIGYAGIRISSINNNECSKITDYYESDDLSIGVVYLRYILVDEKHQHKGYGTIFMAQLQKIFENIKTMLPIRFVILESLNDKKDWYKSIGYKVMKEKENPYMYFDLLSKAEINNLDEYSGRL